MILPSLPGLYNLLKRRPQLLSVGRVNLSRRLRHAFVNGRDQGWSLPPEQLTITVTDICNLRCQMCHYASSDSPGYSLSQVGHMDMALFKKILREIEGRPLISFTGGEPLLHPEIDRLVALAHASGHLTTMTTNGWFLAKRAAALCQAGLDMLVVSVDGPESVHNHIRGAKVFERLVSGIQRVLAQPNRPIVLVSLVVSDLNDDQLLHFYHLARQWGVDGLNINHLWMQTSEMVAACQTKYASAFTVDEVLWDIQPEKVNVRRLSDDLDEMQRTSRWQQLLVTETPFLSPKQREIWYLDPSRFLKWSSTRCAWVWLKIWPDGAVKPCRDWPVGNVQNENVMSVWNGGEMRQFRQFLTQERTLPICARCCHMVHR